MALDIPHHRSLSNAVVVMSGLFFSGRGLRLLRVLQSLFGIHLRVLVFTDGKLQVEETTQRRRTSLHKDIGGRLRKESLPAVFGGGGQKLRSMCEC